MPETLFAALRDTLTDPRGAAARLMASDPPDAARWLGLGAAAAISAILSSVALRLGPGDAAMPGMGMFASPVQAAVVLAVSLLLSSSLVYRIGRFFGGHGGFRDAVLLMVWLQFVLICLQLVQLLLLISVPALAALAGLGGIVLVLWLLTQFVVALHGFRSGPKVLLGVVASLLVTGFVLSVVLTLAGFAPPPEV